MKFNDYKHFTNYCIKSCRLNEVGNDKDNRISLRRFEMIYKFIEELDSKGFAVEGDVLYRASNILVYKGKRQFDEMINELLYEINRYRDDEIHIPYLIKIINKKLLAKIRLNKNKTNDNIFEESKQTVKRNTFRGSYDIQDLLNLKGIYFIYDEKDNLAYIGKSTRCVATRCVESAYERRVGNYTKIEIYFCGSTSDIAVYEAYYISKYKPYSNKDMINDDELTIELPELKVAYTLMNEYHEDYPL